MTTPDPSKFLFQNWEGFKKYATKAALKRSDNNVSTLLENMEKFDAEVTPASTRIEYQGCYPGGLVEHAVRTLLTGVKLRVTYGLEEQVSTDSIVMVSLFHDLGKLGDMTRTNTEKYYQPNPSEWHRSKLGQLYEINPKLSFMPVPQLSLMNLAHNSVWLSTEEWYSISSLKADDSENRLYPKDNEPPLAMILKHAVTASSRVMKNRTSVSDLTLVAK
jgi:hypothetical protein